MLKKKLHNFYPFYLLTGLFIGAELLSVKQVFSQSRLGNPLIRNTLVSHTSLKGYLYMGIDNYLIIKKNNLAPAENYYLKSNNGTVIPDSNGLFLAIPIRTGKARIDVFLINRHDTEFAGYQYFTVKRLPDPKMTINNVPINTPTTLSRIALMNCDSLGVYISADIPGSENWYRITEFTFGYYYGGFYVSHKNSSNILSTQTKNIISVTGPNREITIWPKIECEGKVKLELPVYRITIY